jgi:hypothetical protein
MIFSLLLIGALFAFELFNYSTTDFALNDLLGELKFIGIRWSTILALAFCGIDFAGVARLFTPAEGDEEPMEVWYLFGAWLLAATMNAMLTWWGISIALLSHQSLGSLIIDQTTLLTTIPIFVAVMVWLSRVLIIGTFSLAGERLFSTATLQPIQRPAYSQSRQRPVARRYPQQGTNTAYGNSYRPAPKPIPSNNQIDPSYQPVPMSAKERRPSTTRR